MNYFAELETHGWVCVKNVPDRAEFLELARSLGRPMMSPTGQLIKEIKITSKLLARPGTLSAAHGRGAFPLHTDTAFWPIPARYLMLRIQGDARRPTTVC